jgi:hypothetical protein
VLRFVLRPALIAALMLLIAAPMAPAQSTRNQILRECQNGRLSGDYTAREIRDARSNIPDDVDQYTDCRDVLARALLARAGGGGSGDAAGGGGAGGAGGLGGTTGGGGVGTTGGTGGDTGGAPLTPSTDADRQALEKAATDGAQPVEVAGRPVTPGDARNEIPPTLLVLLILIAAGTVAVLAPQLRRLAVVQRVIPGRSG